MIPTGFPPARSLRKAFHAVDASAGEGRSKKICSKNGVEGRDLGRPGGDRPVQGRRMLKALRPVARFFQERIGWNRVGIVISVTIIVIAAVVLWRMLRGISVDE